MPLLDRLSIPLPAVNSLFGSTLTYPRPGLGFANLYSGSNKASAKQGLYTSQLHNDADTSAHRLIFTSFNVLDYLLCIILS